MNDHKWQFSPRFRRGAFGWKSQPAIDRIKQALSEIKQVTRKEPVLAAEGAVLFLVKLSPALEQVDSSSGAIGAAVNRAVELLVPIIAAADIDEILRQKWLERLWDAIDQDEMPYLESLGNFWGELCGTPKLASSWADRFVPLVASVWRPAARPHGFFKGTGACMSALFASGRHEAILSLLATARHTYWNDRRWGVKALASMGRQEEAIEYAEASRGLSAPVSAIATACEEILLSSGLANKAYTLYALDANQNATNLGTFRAIVKKYQSKPAETVLRDLVAQHPGQEGKWFAAAKHAGLLELAIELANQSPGDPRTLIRAARDYAVEQPAFALSTGTIALRDMACGHGYEITGLDILDAYSAIMLAATAAGVPETEMKERIRALIAAPQVSKFVSKVLAHHLSG